MSKTFKHQKARDFFNKLKISPSWNDDLLREYQTIPMRHGNKRRATRAIKKAGARRLKRDGARLAMLETFSEL